MEWLRPRNKSHISLDNSRCNTITLSVNSGYCQLYAYANCFVKFEENILHFTLRKRKKKSCITLTIDCKSAEMDLVFSKCLVNSNLIICNIYCETYVIDAKRCQVVGRDLQISFISLFCWQMWQVPWRCIILLLPNWCFSFITLYSCAVVSLLTPGEWLNQLVYGFYWL